MLLYHRYSKLCLAEFWGIQLQRPKSPLRLDLLLVCYTAEGAWYYEFRVR